MGAPIKEVTALMGKIDSEKSILLNKEQTEQSNAPPSIHPGMR